MIKFSLITVTYNAEATLERTLRSVAEQTYPHIEHILIDGASKDRTLEIAHTHGQHLAKVVSEPDHGLYDAMNKGLRLATGDYICFLNAGDKLHDADTLERINLALTHPKREKPMNTKAATHSSLETDEASDTKAATHSSLETDEASDTKAATHSSLETDETSDTKAATHSSLETDEASDTKAATPSSLEIDETSDTKAATPSSLETDEASDSLPGVLYGHTDIVDNEGHYISPRRLKPHDGLTWRSFKQGMLVCHQAFYARRDLCPEYDTRYRFSADFDWCIRVMKQTDNLLHLPFPIADYLQEGITTRNHRASLIERFRLMCRHYGVPTTINQHIWFAIRAIIKP